MRLDPPSALARDPSRAVAAAVAALALATILGALASQHLFGLLPCKLCLQQRWPYYLGVPLAAAAAAGPRGPARRAGLAVVAALFLVSAGLGLHHAGVEWEWWPGPNNCGEVAGRAPSRAEDLLKSLETIRVASCTEAAWRFSGLSLAGWNSLISLGLATAAAWGAARRP